MKCMPQSIAIAQTNVQLYNQCLADEWAENDLRRLHKAFLISRRVFPSSYRPSGKAFLSHLIGVASILLRWKQPPTIVISGLLHSIYLYGNFGDKRRGATPQRRAYLAENVGSEIEQCVFNYTDARPKGLYCDSSAETQTILLADAFEEIWDYGNLYSPKKNVPVTRDLSDGGIDRIVKLAEACVGRVAADDFSSILQKLQDARIPDYLTGEGRASKAIEEGIEGFFPKNSPREWLRLLRGRNS